MVDVRTFTMQLAGQACALRALSALAGTCSFHHRGQTTTPTDDDQQAEIGRGHVETLQESHHTLHHPACHPCSHGTTCAFTRLLPFFVLCRPWQMQHGQEACSSELLSRQCSQHLVELLGMALRGKQGCGWGWAFWGMVYDTTV